MKRWLVGILSVFGVLFLLLAGGTAVLLWKMSSLLPGKPDLPNQFLVSLTLEGAPANAPTDPVRGLLGATPVSLRELVLGLERASRDGRVQGLFLDLSHAALSLSDAQEVAAGLGKMKAAGKPVVVFADTFGESGDGTTAYLAASAGSHVWMQPSGDLRLLGMGLERPYFGEALRLLGVGVRLDQRYEYKGIADIFTDEAMNSDLRGQLQRLVDDMTAQSAGSIARQRGLSADAVRGLMAVAPLPAQQAVVEKLVDRLGYRAEAKDDLSRLTRTQSTVSFSDYLAGGGLPHLYSATSGDAIAVIEGSGQVVRSGATGPFAEEAGFSAPRLVKAFEAAAADPSVKVILFRIDSPGGSYVASDTIWAAAKAARAAGKPIVVSMGRLAASGGYFAALPADRIIANGGTLTGSIGVGGGKFVLTDLWSRLGIRWDRVEGAPHAAQDSMNRDFTAEELARQSETLDRIYGDFTRKVAEARKIPPEGIDAVARGRIWTGAQARDVGLVDGIGGWVEALEEARRLARVADTYPMQLKDFPRQEGHFAQVQKLLSRVEASSRLGIGLEQIAARLSPWLMQGEVTAPVR
jgi:protease-4